MNILNLMYTRITHSQKWTVIASLQQTYAIRLVLENLKSPIYFDYDEFYLKICKYVSNLENQFDILDDEINKNIEKYPKDLQNMFEVYMKQKIDFEENFEYLNTQNDTNNDRKSHKNSSNYNSKYSSLLLKLYKLIIKCRKGEKINSETLFKKTTSSDIIPIEIPIGLYSFMIASDKRCSNEVTSLI